MQDRDNLLSRRTQRASSDAASVAKYHMQIPPGFSSEFSPVLWEVTGEGVGGGRGRVSLGCDSGCEAEVHVLQHQPATL